MAHVLTRLAGPLLLTAFATVAQAQGIPSTQPTLVTVVREEVKVGHGAAHAAFEAGWPAAYARAKSTDYYLALVAMTGANESWYITSYPSHAAIGESMKRDDANPVLSAELARLAKGDAEHLNSSRTMQLVAMPALSYGTFPDLALDRFWEITTFRVRPGHEAGFAAAAKAYASAAKRANAGASWRTYSVMAGIPTPTFFVFSSVRNYGEFDAAIAGMEALTRGFSAEEGAMLDKWSKEGMINSETQRFRLDPGQSYVDDATKAKDPAFWAPRKAAARP